MPQGPNHLAAVRLCVLFILSIVYLGAEAVAKADVTVPFVGCVSQGEILMPAPNGSPVAVDLPADVASKLAVYGGSDLVILAPRGWSCGGSNGSDIMSLRVSPMEGNPRKAPMVEESLFVGNALERRLLLSYGGRYFPKAFSQKDIDDGIATFGQPGETRSQFLAPNFPNDTISYVTKSMLEFTTPAGKRGLGTDFGLTKMFQNHGLFMISINPPAGDDEAVAFFGLELPPALDFLQPYIMAFSKDCLSNDNGSLCAVDAVYPGANGK